MAASSRGSGSAPRRPSRKDRDADDPGPLFQVQITASDPDRFGAAIDGLDLDLGCSGPQVLRDGRVSSGGLLYRGQIDALRERDPDMEVEELSNFTETSAERRKEVGRGNRFEAPTALPEGLGELLRDERDAGEVSL